MNQTIDQERGLAGPCARHNDDVSVERGFSLLTHLSIWKQVLAIHR
jgi:hypothetical protein